MLLPPPGTLFFDSQTALTSSFLLLQISAETSTLAVSLPAALTLHDSQLGASTHRFLSEVQGYPVLAASLNFGVTIPPLLPFQGSQGHYQPQSPAGITSGDLTMLIL